MPHQRGGVDLRTSSVAALVCALTAMGGHVLRGEGDSPGSDRGRAADQAGIERLHQQETAATLSRDPVALTALWTDDAIRLSPGRPAEVGKQAIRESIERWSARPGFRVVRYVPETRDVAMLQDGWAVEWGSFDASYTEAPGGEAKELRGTVLTVLARQPDGTWRCFRRMGDAFTAVAGPPAPPPAARDGGRYKGSAEDRAGLEKLRQLGVVATTSRDPVALSEAYTEDAIRLAPGIPAEVGKDAIRASVYRQTANKDMKVLSYVPETRDLAILDGWAVEWRSFTGSFVASPGAEPVTVGGTMLAVWKRLADGSWKCFRAMGGKT